MTRDTAWNPPDEASEPPAARRLRPALAAALLSAPLSVACTPTVKVEAPDKPIQINLNVNINQEVRVRVDRELEQVYQKNPNIF